MGGLVCDVGCWRERDNFVTRPQQTDGNERDFNAAVERFKELRPRVLRPLGRLLPLTFLIPPQFDSPAVQ